jgi:hypothetical protein
VPPQVNAIHGNRHSPARSSARDNGRRRPLARALAAIVVLQHVSGCDGGGATPATAPVTMIESPSGAVVPTRLAVLSRAPLETHPHALVGQVFDAYSGVVSADVAFFVETAGWGRGDGVRTDASGQFTVYAPDSMINVYAYKPGFVQQCAARLTVRSSLYVQLEVTSKATLLSHDPPRPQSASGPSLSGTVFEVSNGVRQPVTGADFWVEQYDDMAVATTVSDLAGGYFVCNLPYTVGIYVTKPGFETARVFVDPSQTPVLDIELKRR